MKNRTLKRWKKLTWDALSKLKRKDGVCMRCGKTKEKRYLHAHHLIPRSRGNYAMFEPDNIVVLCWYCHKMFFHGKATWVEQRDLIEEWIGLARYFEMETESKKMYKYNADDYAKMLEEFKHEM